MNKPYTNFLMNLAIFLSGRTRRNGGMSSVFSPNLRLNEALRAHRRSSIFQVMNGFPGLMPVSFHAFKDASMFLLLTCPERFWASLSAQEELVTYLGQCGEEAKERRSSLLNRPSHPSQPLLIARP